MSSLMHTTAPQIPCLCFHFLLTHRFLSLSCAWQFWQLTTSVCIVWQLYIKCMCTYFWCTVRKQTLIISMILWERGKYWCTLRCWREFRVPLFIIPTRGRRKREQMRNHNVFSAETHHSRKIYIFQLKIKTRRFAHKNIPKQGVNRLNRSDHC